MSKPPQDYGIPMLTEVLETPAHGVEELVDIPELTQLAEPVKAKNNVANDVGNKVASDAAMAAEPDVAGNFVTDFALNLTPYKTPPSAQQASASATDGSTEKTAVSDQQAEESMDDDDTTPSSAILKQWQDEEWALLQDQITERVLAQIMRRIDAQLELRVRDNLADVLQLAIHKLSEEIRAGLQHTLEDVINDAVKHEITQVKFSKE